MLMAAKSHAGQDREGDNALPYLTHPIEVLMRLRMQGGVRDLDVLCAALLHDVVEECGVQPSRIEQEFGQRVASLVRELTRTEPTPEQAQGLDADALWKLRADMLLQDIAGMGPDAMTVKLADRISNVLGALETKRGRKLDRYVRQTRKILRVIPRDVNPPLYDELKTVTERAEREMSKKK